MQTQHFLESAAHAGQTRPKHRPGQPRGERLGRLACQTLRGESLFELIEFRVKSWPGRGGTRVLRFAAVALAPAAEDNLVEQQRQDGDQRPEQKLTQAGLAPAQFCEFKLYSRPEIGQKAPLGG